MYITGLSYPGDVLWALTLQPEHADRITCPSIPRLNGASQGAFIYQNDSFQGTALAVPMWPVDSFAFRRCPAERSG